MQLKGAIAEMLSLYHPKKSGTAREVNVDFEPEVEIELAAIKKVGAKVTWPGRIDYPQQFQHLQVPPRVLTYLGQPIWLEEKCFSIVGSRQPSVESIQWMDRVLPIVLRELRTAVVSGGARGIDQKAHQIALRLGVPTVIFLPSGLANAYPKEIAKWFAPVIAGGGAIVSEFPVYRRMFKSNFFQRNRLIAGLSRQLLVVEARQTGGTMMTANWAADQGIEVLVPPAHPMQADFKGNIKLLAEGARMVVDETDFYL